MKESKSQSSRIGLAISKKTGAAVQRNRLKRLYREALRKVLDESGDEFRKPYDFVFIGKKECLSAKMPEVARELKGLLSKIKGAGN